MQPLVSYKGGFNGNHGNRSGSATNIGICCAYVIEQSSGHALISLVRAKLYFSVRGELFGEEGRQVAEWRLRVKGDTN